MDDIGLRTSIFSERDCFQLKRRQYFEGEIPHGSTMSKYYLINDEQKYWEVKFGEGDLSITNEY